MAEPALDLVVAAREMLLNAALLVAIAVVIDLVPEQSAAYRAGLGNVVRGLLIGLIGGLIMGAPWHVGVGVFVDTRSVLLSVTGLVLGGVPTIIAMVAMGIWRMAIGGAGAWVGLASILAAGALGMAWRARLGGAVTTLPARDVYLFGLAVSAIQVALLGALPGGMGGTVASTVAIPLLVIYPVATVLLTHLMSTRVRRAVLSAALAADEERLRLALEAARLGLFDLDLATGRANVNDRYAEMFGEDPATYEATTEAWVARLHPDDRDAMVALFAEYLTAGRTAHRIEFRLRRADGSWCWVLSMGRLFGWDANGRPSRMLGIHLDVTAEREAQSRSRAIVAERDRLLEEANASRRALLSLVEDLRVTQRTLEQSLERYSSLVRHSPDAILVDRADRLVLVNDALMTLMGATDESQLLGMDPLDVFAPGVRDIARERIRVVLEQGRPVPVRELRIQRLDGTEVDVEAAASPFQDHGVAAIHLVMRDITDRKRAEQAIVTLNAQLEERVQERTVDLEEAYRELESFSYSVSHDLRAPLRAITGFSQILSRRHRDQLDETGRHYLDNISIAGERMGALIEDLLGYSRVGRRDVRRDTVDIGALTDSVIATLAPRIIETGATIGTDGALARPMGDSTLIQQVLLNLIGNGITYIRDDVPPEVTVRSVRHGDHVEVSVEDNGIGIAAEHHDRVFEVFARLHTEDEIPGTGIGLAIVRKAAHLMDGEVGLRSSPGAGSTFTLRLPVATEES